MSETTSTEIGPIKMVHHPVISLVNVIITSDGKKTNFWLNYSEVNAFKETINQFCLIELGEQNKQP